MANVKKTAEAVETEAVTAAAADPMEELVDFYRPPLPYEGADQQINLTLNGVTMSYIRGNHVQMPRKYVAMVETGEAEQMDAVRARMQMQSEYEKSRAVIN